MHRFASTARGSRRPVAKYIPKKFGGKNYAPKQSNILADVGLPSPGAASTFTLPIVIPREDRVAINALQLLSTSCLVIGRQMEMMNLLLGYEQANKYSIKDYMGNQVGYICEEEKSFKSAILRQLLKTRRAFHADVLDQSGNLVLKIHRPIRWFLNSKISVCTHDGQEIGHCSSDWHLWRRRYDLFIGKEQNNFAKIDGGFWAWDFSVTSPAGLISSINRNFVGLLKEIFADMGQYIVHFDSTEGKVSNLSLDQRAILLATAISIDIDYFSRHSGNSGIMPIGMMGSTNDGDGSGGGAGGAGTGPIATGAGIGGVAADSSGLNDTIDGGTINDGSSTLNNEAGGYTSSERDNTPDNSWGSKEFLPDEPTSSGDESSWNWTDIFDNDD